MMKTLLLNILQKLLDLLPDPPKEKDEYFSQQESLQGELRRLLEKYIDKLNKPNEGADFSIGEDGELSSSNALLDYYIAAKNFWSAVPRWLKLIVLSVTPVLFVFYFILYPLLVSDAEQTKEQIFRVTEGKPLVRITYIREWPSSVVSMHLASMILKTSLNCEVLHKPVSQRNLVRAWEMAVNDDADIFLSAWLPAQDNFKQQAKDRLEDLGPFLTGARMGLIVPSYVKINSVKDLNAEDFGGVIYGIDQASRLNAGIFSSIEDYGLEGFIVEQKGDAYMLKVLQKALKERRNIVVAGWAPHWMFGKWSLKFLEDPKGVFGRDQSIHFFANRKFYDKFPRICHFFQLQELNVKQMSELMLLNREGGEGLVLLQRWIKDNPVTVRKWFPGTDTGEAP